MDNDKTPNLKRDLRILADNFSPVEILQEFAAICRVKADIIRRFWGDIDIPAEYEKNAAILTKSSLTIQTASLEIRDPYIKPKFMEPNQNAHK